MCQAYEAEAAFIRRWEQRYELHGFLAALDGKPRTAPPRTMGYELKAWEHGYDCFTQRVFPWAGERLIGAYDTRRRARERFKTAGKLHPAHVALFRKEGWIVS